MEFNANGDKLNAIRGLIGQIKEKMTTLHSGLNDIGNMDLSGTGLSNIGLIGNMKSAIKEIINGTYGDKSLSKLENKINNTIKMLNNSNTGEWFSKIEQFSYEEYENFADFLDSIDDTQIIYAKQLTGPLGYVEYERPDGRTVKETWCNLEVGQLVKNMREMHGIDLEYWVREDGVRMYGPYVMVATDVPAMGGWNQEAEYRYGDLVETTLGTGIVVDWCGDAVDTRRNTNGAVIRYDIYAAWYEEPYFDMYYYRANGEMHGKPEAIESQIVGVKYREKKATVLDETGTEAYTPKEQSNKEPTTTTLLNNNTPGTITGSLEHPIYTQQQQTTQQPNTYYTQQSNQTKQNQQAMQQTTIPNQQEEIPPVETVQPSTEQTVKPVVDIGESVHIKEDTVTEVEENINEDNIVTNNTDDSIIKPDDELINEPYPEQDLASSEMSQNSTTIQSNKGGLTGGIIGGLLASIAAFFGIKYGKKKLKNKDNDDI